jgi:hypothetical protein
VSVCMRAYQATNMFHEPLWQRKCLVLSGKRRAFAKATYLSASGRLEHSIFIDYQV